MVDLFLTLVVLGLACACLSVTVTKSHMFMWFRALFVSRPSVLQLVSCHYCMGHWFALALVAAHNPWPSVLGFVTSWLAVTGISAVASMKIIGE